MEVEPQEAETQAAIGLVYRVVLVAFLLYFGLSLVVTPDARLTWYGWSETNTELIARGGRRMYYATHEAWTADRSDDRPQIVILGSSITREAFDETLLQHQLDARDLDWRIEKYAFDRGAPLFSWAVADQMDLRPGDRVVTTVHYDNFRRDWLDFHGGFHSYMNHILRPRHLFAIEELSVADQLEYSLSSVPPQDFHRAREGYRDGLERWLAYWTWRTEPDEGAPEIEAPRSFNERQFVPNFRELTRNAKVEMTAGDLQLERGQTNHDALLALEALCEERGAELWVLFLPSSPEYYERFERGQFSETFHSHMRATFNRYVRMSPLPQDHYTDYKHANLVGRPILTRQLAHLMARTPFGEPLPNAPSSPPTEER
jgi:hypothetical protein